MAEEILQQRTRVALRAIRQQVIGKPAVLARVSGIEGVYGFADPEAEVPALDHGFAARVVPGLEDLHQPAIDFGGIDPGVA